MAESLNGPRLDLGGPLWAVCATIPACLSIAIYLRLLFPAQRPGTMHIHDFRSPSEEFLPYYGIAFTVLAILFCRISWHKERALAASVATCATAASLFFVGWAWYPFFR